MSYRRLQKASTIFTHAFFLLATVLFVGPWVKAQPPAPPPVAAPSKEVGKAKVFYVAKWDQTQAEAFSYIQGNAIDVYDKKKEVIGMTLRYAVKGSKASRPDFFSLTLTSYSAKPDKYTKNHLIKLIVEGREILSEIGIDQYVNLPFLRGSSESYAIPRFSYSYFEEIAGAKNVSIQIGGNVIGLKKDDLQAFKDLKSTFEN
ncbi:MAG: hypothetical protein QM785_13380 [Pyrinomonadaceae bacterium]